jgi:hypothetical protein
MISTAFEEGFHHPLAIKDALRVAQFSDPRAGIDRPRP